MELSALERLRPFRQGIFNLCSHRADALCDVIDGALTAGLVPSFAYLSLRAAHQRGHGSLYAALAKGRMDVEGIRKLVASTLPKENRPVYAIDTSTYIRSDAETSPERGIYYHTSRHSAGKPVGAGWSYSWCAQLGGSSSSWTVSVDSSRVPIELDAHDIAGRQMRAAIASSPAGIKPLFVFDAGYDSTRLAEQLAVDEAAVLVRLRRNRCFFFDPVHEPQPLGGRPRQHGAKFICNDLSTWPKPDFEHVEADGAMGMCGLGLGTACTRKCKIMRVVGRAKPEPSSRARSSCWRSPSCLEKPASLEPSACGGGVPQNLTSLSLARICQALRS